ncbi:MAG: ATP-dependent Clp protease proteolytic subunit [Verrucomicrobiota bacterium]
MGNWNDLADELRVAGSPYDIIRRKYLAKLHQTTGRNVIAYYSGWLQKPGNPFLSINDADKNGFMTTIHELDRTKGLDLLLHTPGGETAATESIVDYLRSMFSTDIRAIVPQLAMSAGTMIACACKQIVMGKHSSLGPIDPQFGGIAAHGIIEEFNQAQRDIKSDPSFIHVWQPIFHKYQPTLIGECVKAIQWSETMVAEWLSTGMFKGQADVPVKVKKVMQEIASHALTLSHARHLSAAKCKELGLDIVMLEEKPDLQDAVLTVHHAMIHTLSSTNAVKIIENHNGVAAISSMKV